MSGTKPFTSNFKNRFYQHKNNLLKNKHCNSYLQNAVNKYGIENFKFEILEECDKEFLNSQENYWVQMLCTY